MIEAVKVKAREVKVGDVLPVWYQHDFLNVEEIAKGGSLHFSGTRASSGRRDSQSWSPNSYVQVIRAKEG